MFGKALLACNGVNTSEPTVDLTNGLVAHYLLNNNADDSHGDYDGTSVGGVDFKGDVAEFDGSDDYIETFLTDPLSTNKTFSIWFQASSTSGTQALISAESNLNAYQGTSILIEDDFLSFVSRESGGSYKTISMAFTDTIAFNCAVIVIEDDYIKAYLNGVFYDELYMETSGEDGDRVRFGAVGSNNLNFYFNGNLSNIRIYNDAKDQSFIDELYTEGYYPKPLPLPTTNGLIAHYPLTGTAEDSTGNYNVVENGVTYVDDSEFGSVSDFDGNTSRIESSIAGLQSMSLWVKFDDTSSNVVVSTGSGELEIIAWGSNVLRTYIEGSSKYYTILDSWTSGVWYNIIVQREGADWKSYVDGVFQYSLTDAQSSFYIAGFGDNPANRADYNLNGKMKDIRLYDVALTQQEITDIYNYEKNFRAIGIDDGLVAYYPLASNSVDNYYSQYDGVDTDMAYDGNSGSFDGISSMIQMPLPDSSYTSSFTLGCWAKFNSSFINQPFIAKRDGTGGNDFYFGMNVDGELRVLAWELTTTSLTHTYSFEEDTWYYLTTRYDGNTLKLYINDTEVASIGSTGSVSNSANNIRIGHDWYDSYMDGNLAKVRIYNKALSKEQIQVIYDTEKGDFI